MGTNNEVLTTIGSTLTEPAERPFLYTKDHCWQYDIRLRNAEQDLGDAGLTFEEASDIKVSDLSFRFVDKTETEMCKRIVCFIKRHEWLGTMPLHPTHRFIAEHNGHLAGVIIMGMPSAFSKLLGEDTKNLERLISRGACVSWSPKNTASALLMYSISWMVENTPFRLFTAYADPEAKELGTIYQACNFSYLGQNSGTQRMYFDPPSRRVATSMTVRSVPGPRGSVTPRLSVLCGSRSGNKVKKSSGRTCPKALVSNYGITPRLKRSVVITA
jgi:hypothetical protein